MDAEQIVKDVIQEDLGFKSIVVKKPIDVDLDVGHLLAIDTNPVDLKALR